MSDYLEQALAVEERRIVDAHFESCTACRELLTGIAEVMQWGKSFPVQTAPPWLSTRIVANTPRVVRVTFRDLVLSGWRALSEPRFALGVFTATLVLGWMGSTAGISMDVVRNPTAIYHNVEGWMNRAYGDAVRNYYRSPLVNEIQCQIHTRLEKLREMS
jgi:hypothetical protein